MTSLTTDCAANVIFIALDDPVVGRFISKDPVGFDPQDLHSFNRYAYANNNPYRYVDPDGRASVALVLAGVGAAAVGVGIYSRLPADQQARVLKGLGQLGQHTALGQFGGLLSGVTLNESDNSKSKDDADAKSDPEGEREKTPTTDPDRFDSVRGTKAKRDKETGEIWEKDRLHKDHYEVYSDKKDYDKGRRDRDVWEDGRPKGTF